MNKRQKKKREKKRQDLAQKMMEVLPRIIEEAIGDNHIFEGNGIRGIWGF